MLDYCVKCDSSHTDWYGVTCGYCGDTCTELERDQYFTNKVNQLIKAGA